MGPTGMAQCIVIAFTPTPIPILARRLGLTVSQTCTVNERDFIIVAWSGRRFVIVVCGSGVLTACGFGQTPPLGAGATVG